MEEIFQKTPLRNYTSKKVLPMWEYSRFVVVGVDEEGSCRNQHILNTGKWHRYYDERGQLHAARCPHLLGPDEKSRVILDDPPGTWEIEMAGKKEERLRIEAAKRIAEKQQARTGGYNRGNTQG